MCEKCGVTFGRRDSVQRHVRTVCSRSSSRSSSSRSSSHSSSRRRGPRENTTTYMWKKCGRHFDTNKDLTKHAQSPCAYVKEPPLPKRSTPPVVTEEDLIEPPGHLPFSETMSTGMLDVVREHWSTIKTRVSRGPLQCRYDYRLTTLDTTVLEAPLKIMFQHTSKLNVSSRMETPTSC